MTGTYDANEHTEKRDIQQQPITNGQGDKVYESRTTGGQDYTLAYVGYGEIPVKQDPPASSN